LYNFGHHHILAFAFATAKSGELRRSGYHCTLQAANYNNRWSALQYTSFALRTWKWKCTGSNAPMTIRLTTVASQILGGGQIFWL